jgi:hypothetical protein
MTEMPSGVLPHHSCSHRRGNMRELTEKWLEDINAEFRKMDIPTKQRPWLACGEWSKYTGISISMDGDVAKTIFTWFEKNTKAGSQHIGSLYTGAYYYDSCLWPVFIQIAYGRVKLDARDALKTMPDSIVATLFKDRNRVAEYVLVWADCVDYGFGIDDLKKTAGFGKFAQELLNSGDQQLRATVALLLQDRPSPKATEFARMSTEMFLKAFLAARTGLTEQQAKNKIGHDIGKALIMCLDFDTKSELKDIQPHLNVFPDIGDRYKGSDEPLKEIWRAYAIAQCAGTTVARALSGRDISKTIKADEKA